MTKSELVKALEYIYQPDKHCQRQDPFRRQATLEEINAAQGIVPVSDVLGTGSVVARSELLVHLGLPETDIAGNPTGEIPIPMIFVADQLIEEAIAQPQTPLSGLEPGVYFINPGRRP